MGQVADGFRNGVSPARTVQRRVAHPAIPAKAVKMSTVEVFTTTTWIVSPACDADIHVNEPRPAHHWTFSARRDELLPATHRRIAATDTFVDPGSGHLPECSREAAKTRRMSRQTFASGLATFRNARAEPRRRGSGGEAATNIRRWVTSNEPPAESPPPRATGKRAYPTALVAASLQ